MRSLALLGLVVVVLAATAVLSPWVTWALVALLDHPFTFKRVYDRVFEALLAVAVVVAWRRLDLGTPASLGVTRASWARDLARGLAVGLVGVGLALGLCALAGAIDPSLRYPPAKTAWKALLGLLAAVLIGLGEEVLFRGVLLRRLSRDAGVGVAVVVTTVVYAAVHVLRGGGAVGADSAWSGVQQTRLLLAPLAGGARAELVGLGLLGLALAAARLRTGSLWVAVGIHGAWVAAFRVGRLFFDVRPSPVWLVGAGWPPLVGGAAAWVGAAAMAGLIIWRGRKSPFAVM